MARRARLPLALIALLLLPAGCSSTPRILGTTILGDTSDRIGPYSVLTQVTDANGDKITLHVRPGNAGEAVISMTEERLGVFRGLIPGQEPFTRVCYFVEVEDGDQVVTDPVAARSTDPGLCFEVLGTSCQQDTDCAPGEGCDEQKVCRQKSGSCSVDTDCGKGFRCGPLKTCLLGDRPCQHDEGCLLGEVCDKLLGQCVPRPRCDGGLTCPLDFHCDQTAGACVRACLGAADCGPGETCESSRCSGALRCVAAACPVSLTCDPVLKICRPPGAGLCAPCTRDSECGGSTDFCLLLGAGQFCGRDCLTKSCPDGYVCGKSTSPPQCQPVSGACPQ